MLTATLTPALSVRAGSDPATGAAVWGLTAYARDAGDLRQPPAPWRASYPNDDPERYAPDLWIADLPAGTVWCKADVHDVWNPHPDGRCSWCGMAHGPVLVMYAFMDPADY